MGISYSSIVCVGFRVSLEDVTEETTKYNEDTGEPYAVSTVVGNKIVGPGGMMISRPSGSDPNHYQGDRIEGLELFGDGYDSVNQLFLGVEIAKTRGGNGLEPFETTIPQAVTQFSKKFNVDAEFALIMSCG